MTDERAPDGAPNPTTEPTAAPPPPPPLAPIINQAAASAPAAPAPPPPLAPIVNQAAAPAPSYAPPPIPPPAMPQPAVAWAPASAPVAVAGKRTGLAMIAGILMILGGILWGLLGLLVAVVGPTVFANLGDFADFPELNGADPGAVFGGILAFAGILLILVSLMYLIGGIGVLRSAGWGRVLGIIAGILGTLFWLSAVSNAGSISGVEGQSSLITGIVLLAINIYIVAVLLFFWRSKVAST